MTNFAASTAHRRPGPTAHESLTGSRRAVAIFAVLSAMTLVVLDAGIANVALPELGRALGVSPSETMLVVTAYQAGLVMALIPAGALGERFGYAHVFTTGVLIFAAASGGCALAPSLPWLIAARAAQGLGGAAIMALGVALLRRCVPHDRLGAAIGWNALTVALASAVAPCLGALILSVANWPVLFAINLPLAALTLAASRALPPNPRKTAPPDILSMALNASAFGLLIVAAESAFNDARLAVSLFGAGAIALAALLRREARKPLPLIPLDLLRGDSFRLSVIASVCCFTGQSAGLVALAFQLQAGLGLTPLAAGLYLTAWPMSVAVAALVSGRLSDHMPTAWLCAAGGVFMSAGLAGATTGAHAGNPAVLIPFIALAGAGFGLFQSPNNRNMFVAAPAERSGAAGGMQGTARVIGQTLGALLMALLFTTSSMESAPRLGLGAAAALTLLAGLVSLLRIPP